MIQCKSHIIGQKNQCVCLLSMSCYQDELFVWENSPLELTQYSLSKASEILNCDAFTVINNLQIKDNILNEKKRTIKIYLL